MDAADRIAQLEDENRLLKERVEQLARFEPRLKSVKQEGSAIVISYENAREVKALFASAFLEILKHVDAKNYVETSFEAEDGTRMTVTVQRVIRKTPHQFRLEAEKERDAAIERLNVCEGALSETLAQQQERREQLLELLDVVLGQTADPARRQAFETPTMVAERRAVLDAARKRFEDLLKREADFEAAAGELLVPIPNPGTDGSRLLSANVLLRRDLAAERERHNHSSANALKKNLRKEQWAHAETKEQLQRAVAACRMIAPYVGTKHGHPEFAVHLIGHLLGWHGPPPRPENDHHGRYDCLLRYGRWGTCADCPRDPDGKVWPERCLNASRYDHLLTVADG